jgi:hypothetical protein
MRSPNKKKTIRTIHSSHSFEKKLKRNLKREKTKDSVYRDLFFLVDEEEENSSEVDENPELNIVIYYDGRKISTKFNRHKTFSEFTKFLQKKYFKIGFEKNYKIFYEQQEIPMNDKRKIKNIVGEDKHDIKFILQAKNKNFINDGMKKVYIELENIPSFMDLSDQINNFLNSQNDFGINFDIKYKDNCCRILFSSTETAFSFVSFITNIKFSNKFYRKLKIDIKYNALENSDIYRHLRSMSEKEINNNNNENNNGKLKNVNKHYSISNINNLKTRFKMRLKRNSKNVNIEENYNRYPDFSGDNFKSVQDSSPYGYEKKLAKMEEIMNKKKWMDNKNFFTNISKNSFNSLFSPHKPFLNKFRNNFKRYYGNRDIQENENVINPYTHRVYKLKISDI